jgi:hypothetical protein
MATAVTFDGSANSISRATGTHWVTDRAAIDITSVADGANSALSFNVAGPVPAESFYRYQGAQIVNGAGATFDLGVGSEVSYRFYIDPAWGNDGLKQTSGVWTVMQNAANPSAAYYSIAEYVDPQAAAVLVAATPALAGFTGGFRFWNSTTGWDKYQNVSSTGWVDVKFAFGAAQHSWAITKDGTSVATYLDASIPPAAHPTVLQTVIVDSQNFGVAEQYVYDDITLVRANAPLTDHALNGIYMINGTGIETTGFKTVDAKDLELALQVGEKFSGNADYDAPAQGTVINGVTHYARNEPGDDLTRVQYSVAAIEANTSLAAKLAKYDVKMSYDTDASAAEQRATFILQAKTANPADGYKWIFDDNNNGTIDLGETTGIMDDKGNAGVTQNSENPSWFDSTPGNGLLAKGSYDIRLEAYNKGTTTLAVENHIVIDIDGGAPASSGGGGGGGGGGGTPTPAPTANNDPDGNGYDAGIPALVVANFVNGGTPASAEKLASLTAFADAQYNAYKAAGVLNSAIGPFEAIGRGLSETVEFTSKYGAQTEAAFITSLYKTVFGKDATPAQQAHFQAQIDYFEAMYESAKISSEKADLYAKGAVLGQMLGIATLEGPSAKPLLAEATAFLTDAADGKVDFGQPLSHWDVV